MEFNYEQKKFIRKGVISENNQPKNQKRVKEVTASTLSEFPPNKQGRAVAYCR